MKTDEGTNESKDGRIIIAKLAEGLQGILVNNIEGIVKISECDLKEVPDIMEKLEKKHQQHIDAYGVDNDQRLTGLHETCDINTFRWGVSDRGASVRVPWQVSVDGKGYLEDRRPSSNMDPYVVCHKLIETICGE